MSGLGRNQGHVETRAGVGAGRQVSSCKARLLDGDPGPWRQLQGERRFGIEVPALLGRDGHAGAGHPTGDQVLKRVAAILKASARKIDIVARYGGEEFALVLEGTDRTGARQLAELADDQRPQLRTDSGRRFLIAHRNQPHLPDLRGLSQREATVAAFAQLGQTNKEIAYTLGISPSSVATHLSAALRKLGLPSRAALAATSFGQRIDKPVPTPSSDFEAVFAALQQAGVHYLVVGGVAVVFHGYRQQAHSPLPPASWCHQPPYRAGRGRSHRRD